MPLSRPDAEAKAFFDAVLPADPRIKVRPMFGNSAAFVGGNMFAGLYGNQIFVRLPDSDRAELLAEEGATPFAPMAGRPMKEYVALPAAWRQDPEQVRAWIERSLRWAGELPAK